MLYREVWERRNVEFLGVNLLKYSQVTTIYFAPELSNGTEDDELTLLNIPAYVI